MEPKGVTKDKQPRGKPVYRINIPVEVHDGSIAFPLLPSDSTHRRDLQLLRQRHLEEANQAKLELERMERGMA